MMSFGGYYAVRLALSEPRIFASVNVGGPIAVRFTKRHVKKVPDVMIATIAHAAGQTYPMKPDRMQQLTASLTLDREGFLVNPKYRIPLLSINGDADPLVPIDDVYIISKKGIKQEEWVYKGSGHCATDKISEWAPRAAQWLMNHLEANRN